MSKEAMEMALEALEDSAKQPVGKRTTDAITALREALAEQPAHEEPLTFKGWLAKQHGDPEEIGFLQALRIAYIAGQDSITKGNT